MMQPQANRERVIIRSSFASRLPEVVADLRSVRQIALNLLSNAIRYTLAGGQVIVSTAYESSGDVVMRVRDTGIGMTPGRDRAGAEAVQADQLAEAGARRRHRARPAADQGDGRGQPRALHDQFDAGRRHAGRDHVPVDARACRLELPGKLHKFKKLHRLHSSLELFQTIEIIEHYLDASFLIAHQTLVPTMESRRSTPIRGALNPDGEETPIMNPTNEFARSFLAGTAPCPCRLVFGSGFRRRHGQHLHLPAARSHPAGARCLHRRDRHQDARCCSSTRASRSASPPKARIRPPTSS